MFIFFKMMSMVSSIGLHVCAKFHAFITKCTIPPIFGSTVIHCTRTKCRGNEGLMANSKKLDPRQILGGGGYSPPPGVAAHAQAYL